LYTEAKQRHTPWVRSPSTPNVIPSLRSM
jgi:hypothetical protein